MQIAIMGIALGLNLVIILFKIHKNRHLDATIDGTILATLAWLFSGTVTGLMIGTIGSSIVSLYLLAIPPKVRI